MRHARQLKYCSRGIRDFCLKYDLDYTELIKNGLDAELLMNTNDYLAIDMVKVAEQERLGDGRK